MCYYDTAEHLGSTGKALAIAAETFDSVEVAAPRLTDAINLHSSEYPRSHTFSQIRLATLTMKIGDPRQAVEIGMDSLTHSRGLYSTRIATELRGLATAASRHRRISEVRELREAIATTTSPRSSS
ncbi:hypothetical protein [Nocardia australiensis]|uniref:hypothetical protein n=1 Tax=Nocardia australiensis TaxID=2887191 RepID=UPI001D147BE2|nr:hypothetical protein [Nocardia australiensis]